MKNVNINLAIVPLSNFTVLRAVKGKNILCAKFPNVNTSMLGATFSFCYKHKNRFMWNAAFHKANFTLLNKGKKISDNDPSGKIKTPQKNVWCESDFVNPWYVKL